MSNENNGGDTGNNDAPVTNNIVNEIQKNEARVNAATIVENGTARIWTNPTTRDVEFEFIERQGVDWTAPNAIWRKYGFLSGRIRPSGNIIYLTLEDGTFRVLEVSPREFDRDYTRAMSDYLKLRALEQFRLQEKNPELSMRFAQDDPMFVVMHKELLQNGKSFLVRNLKPLEKILETGKRGSAVDAQQQQLINERRRKRLTVGKAPDMPPDPRVIEPFLQNSGKMPDFNKVKIDKQLTEKVCRYVNPGIPRRLTEPGATVSARGLVDSSANETFQRIEGAIWICRACGFLYHRHTTKFLETPKAPSECPNCEEEYSFEEHHKTINTAMIRLQPDLLNVTDETVRNESVLVMLRGDDQTAADLLGVAVSVRGHVERRPNKDGSYETVVIADKIYHTEKTLEITQWDELCIKRFAGIKPLGYTTLYKHPFNWLESDYCLICGWKGRFTNSKDVYLDRNTVVDRLRKLVAPFLVLDKYQQTTPLLAATGAPEWSPDIRGRINIIFIGPPGTVKTLLAEWTTKLRRTSKKSDATNLTGLSATAMVLPDESGRFNITVGPFVLARYGIYHCDEYEKLHDDQRDKMLSASEKGIVYVDKYDKHREIPAPTTLLATANPRDNKWSKPDTIDSDEFGIPLQQLNRFDVITIFRDEINKDSDRKYAAEKSIREERQDRWRNAGGDAFIISFLQKYIEYVRREYPAYKIELGAAKLLNEYWVQIRDKKSAIILKRNLEGIKRIARCMARLSHQTVVTEEIAIQTMEYLNGVLKPLISNLRIVRQAEDEIFYQVVEYVKARKGKPVGVMAATKDIIQHDKRLLDHITGEDKKKNWPLEPDRNPHYRKLCDAVKEHQYIEIVKSKPLTVRWKQKEYVEDENLRRQKEEKSRECDESSIEMYQQSASQKGAPLPETEISTPHVPVDKSGKTIQSMQGSIEESYETTGVQNSVNQGEGDILLADRRYISLEDNTEIVVKSDYPTAMSMLYGSAAAVDFEWNQKRDNELYQAAFKDHTGKRWAFNIKDNEFQGSEPALLRKIITTFKNYRMILGYNSRGKKSDWEILDLRCRRYGIKSPISISEPQQRDGDDDDEPKRFIKLKLENNEGYDIVDVDVDELYRKQIVKNFFATQGININSHELDVVAKTILGAKRGKFTVGGKVTGANVHKQSIEMQKAYGSADAELCYDLAAANNDVVIAVMDEIANIVKISFQEVVDSGPSKWWASYYKNVQHIEPAPNRIIPDKSVKGKSKKGYKGGKILDYKRGEYFNVPVHDFRQLYPNTAIQENLAPDVLFSGDDLVGCGHPACREDPKSLVVTIDEAINKKKYWRCMQKSGCYPRAAKELTAQRARYEQLAQDAREKEKNDKKAIEYELKSTATKTFSNSGYGVFGNYYFPYADKKTAECITAFARTRLARLKDIAEKEFGYNVVYGDTDSCFLLGATPETRKAFEERVEQELKIPARYERTFTRLLLVMKKNYMGDYIDKNGKKGFMVKGLIGKKSGTAQWAKKIFDQVKEYWRNDEKDMMLAAVAEGVAALKKKAGQVPKDDLIINTKCGKDPHTGYNGKAQQHLPQKILGIKYNKREGESVSYYLADAIDSEYDASFTEIFDNISIRKYQERLGTAVIKVLHAAGFAVEDIYETLELKMPPPAALRDALWGGKPQREEEQEEEEEEIEEEE